VKLADSRRFMLPFRLAPSPAPPCDAWRSRHGWRHPAGGTRYVVEIVGVRRSGGTARPASWATLRCAIGACLRVRRLGSGRRSLIARKTNQCLLCKVLCHSGLRRSGRNGILSLYCVELPV
jgi:hypothetical protein